MAKRNKEPKVKIGDRFDKLKVIKQVDMPIMVRKQDKNGNVYKEPNGKTKIGWLCECDCGGKITLPQTTLLTKRSSLRSCNDCPPEKNPNYIAKKITFEENQEWQELYEHVRKNILKYDENQMLPSNIVLRLKGLLYGKYMADNKSNNNANYSYLVVLNTFKFCHPDIQKVLRTNRFNSEQHKINYIFKIVEKNINDVYVRMQNAKKAKEEVQNTMIEMSTNTGAEYQRKTKDVSNKYLEDLW